MKQIRVLNGANKRSPTAPLRVDEPLFNEMVALLAEMLMLDYQEHTQVTVSSPPQTNRNFSPNVASSLLQSAQQPIRRTDAPVDRDPDPGKETP